MNRRVRPAKPQRSWLKPRAEKARMIRRRFENIVTNIRHRITNAARESVNSRIQWVKYTARWFRNTKNAIYFYCGRLDLMPATH